MNATIIDFGFMTKYPYIFGAKGTPIYVAPEVLKSNSPQRFYDTEKADVHSLGIILLAMIAGLQVFSWDFNPNYNC